MIEIHSKLERVKDITEQRKTEGWTLFQPDEEWEYETRRDERVCPVCWSFEGRFPGDQIPVEFQYWQRRQKNMVYPNTHESYPFLRGDCRCRLEWPDYLYVLAERLMDEIRVATL